MVRLRRSLLAIVIGSAMISRVAVAQRGASSSLTHTVSVTVPPRVKVQVAAFAPTPTSALRVGSVMPSTAGLALSVSATRAWVLSIGSGSSAARNTTARWISGDQGTATVFFQNVFDASSADQRDHSGPPVVLTISAP
ncbi:MAG TPA: hypothetical protein VN927_00430 [Gemmatimonadaceae bacterium]|nr:hypothetical protein [Gemmatimonadaceae bacterium]